MRKVHFNDWRKYDDFKEELSQRFPYDIDSYTTGKEQLVSKI